MSAEAAHKEQFVEHAAISIRRAIFKGLLLGSIAMIAAHISLFAYASSAFQLAELKVLDNVYPLSILAIGSLFAALMSQKYISYFYWIPRTAFVVMFVISLLTGVLFVSLTQIVPQLLPVGVVAWFVANYFAFKLLMTEPASHDEKAGLVQPMAAVQMHFILAFAIAASGLKGIEWVIISAQAGAILMLLASCYGINGRGIEHRRKRFIFNMFILPIVIISFAVVTILGELSRT